MKTRVFNIIERAANEFGFEYDMEDSLQDIACNAENIIYNNVEYDRVDTCERSAHYDHISWNDGNGFSYEADGQFTSSDDSKNTYFRRGEDGSFSEIDWFEHTDDDYVLMDLVIDTDAQVVALIAK